MIRRMFIGVIGAGSLAAVLGASEGIVGTWDLISSTPDGDMRWTLVVRNENGKLTGTATGSQGQYDLQDAALEGDESRFNVRIDDAVYRVKLNVNGDKLTGTWTGPDDSGKIAGTKKS